MNAFIEELLELVRRHADPTLEVRRAPTDLVEVVSSVVADVGDVGHGQQVIVEADGPVVGEWDAARLERAVANLVSNAIKYNRQNGRVWIRVGTRHTPSGDVAECAVADEGIGIPEADLARIFERFTRGANVTGRVAGSGVGLAIVRQVVEQHGGEVTVTSTEGKGSTFTIRLPLAPQDPVGAVRVNVLGTATVLNAVEETNASLIFASSAEVYGSPERRIINEDAPLRPENPYAATKVAAEALAHELGDRVGGRRTVVILRATNQIGPRQHPGLAASTFAKQIAEAEAGAPGERAPGRVATRGA